MPSAVVLVPVAASRPSFDAVLRTAAVESEPMRDPDAPPQIKLRYRLHLRREQ